MVHYYQDIQEMECFTEEQEQYLLHFRFALSQLAPLSDESWYELKKCLKFRVYAKGEHLLRAGSMPKNYYFICKGTVIVYYQAPNAKLYIKNILFENDFPAATASLIKNVPSNLSMQTMEDSLIICFSFHLFRELIAQFSDLKDIYLKYLEMKWVLEKDEVEISLATECGEERYLKLLQKYPQVEKKMASKHIANYLGITPTQLSRIRKKILENQHM